MFNRLVMSHLLGGGGVEAHIYTSLFSPRTPMVSEEIRQLYANNPYHDVEDLLTFCNFRMLILRL